MPISIREFVINYKLEHKGGVLVGHDRFFPSSKMCSNLRRAASIERATRKLVELGSKSSSSNLHFNC